MSMKKKIAGGSRGGGLWRRVRFVSNGLQSDEYAAVLKNADVVLDTYPVRPCNSRIDETKRRDLATAKLISVRLLQFGSFISSEYERAGEDVRLKNKVIADDRKGSGL